MRKLHLPKTVSKAIVIALGTFVFLCIIALALLGLGRASFSQKNGTRELKGLLKEVIVQRDANLIPKISADSRADALQALGFLHAQERFFQMDALRRVPAGELSEIFGQSTLLLDQRLRPFGLRQVAQTIVEKLSPKERLWLKAYALGVNEGLNALKSSPFEYWLLRAKPVCWELEDTFLVCFNLFCALQDYRGDLTSHRETLYSQLPLEVARFFAENGSSWEARIDASHHPQLPIPSHENFDYLNQSENLRAQPPKDRVKSLAPRISDNTGSNCWALTKDLTDGKGALVACDMHLRFSVPNIWYRASMSFFDDQRQKMTLHGATIPGIPALIMGSNQHVAWGFTNAQLNTTDLIRIERIGKNHYLGPEGPLPFQKRIEAIKVHNEKDCNLEILQTIWGPVASANHEKNEFAIRWIGTDWRALDLSLANLDSAKSVQEGIELATAMRAPVLNFFIADHQGQIGWALAGSMPDRDYRANALIDPKQKVWSSLLTPEKMPRKIHSKEGRLWNANHSMLSETRWGYLGTENMLNPIRGNQIKAELFARSNHTTDQMRQLQLNVSAPFMKRWHDLLLEVLQGEFQGNAGVNQRQKRHKMAQASSLWDGMCRADSKGYPVIRRFREEVVSCLLARFLAPCFRYDPSFSPHCFDSEEPIWKLVSERPPYLADASLGSWEAELLKAADATIDYFQKTQPQKSLDQVIWNDDQVLKIDHPLSKNLSFLSRLFDMPSKNMGGDRHVPKVLCATSGATQRMVLYPGNESLSSFEMPGGQSGNPFSSHYRDLHPNWMRGKAMPLLSQKAIHTLRLRPASKN